jgi:hypothetical protein
MMTGVASLAGAACSEFGARRGEADVLDIKADQRRTAETGGGQQQ